MLDREILKLDYGVSYGSVTLSSLQNDAVPDLDLLVREAIQNSSDAAIGIPGDSYAVAFRTGTFVPNSFNAYLTDIETDLNSRYAGTKADFIEIRDTKTSGLTGKIRKSEIKKDNHGNFFKLIYDTGKKQTQVTAGGNHGLGKSVYYRVGIGIVIFYSRIFTDDQYESRLIITLVEDEGKKNPDGSDTTILNKVEPASAGKAWWGIREGEDLLPLTDETYIAELLEVFGLKPFKGSETGTSVVIPYIKTDALLEQIIPSDAEIEDGIKNHFQTVWTASLADYLKLSIQRWYAPKIHNRKLKEFKQEIKDKDSKTWKWLLVTVNDVPVRKQDLLPFFNLTQELYTSALAKVVNSEYESKEYPQISVMPVNAYKYFEGSVTTGYVAMIKISREELNGDQNLLSPYDYIGHFEADGGLNEPIIMYTRDLGMVIDYTVTGPWVKGITMPESPDEYIFAFYVPNTAKLLKHNLVVEEYAGETFARYLRDCESSDHMEWNDPVKMQIVARIQKNTVNQIHSMISKQSNVQIDATASKLSNRLGRNLLPRVGYGKSSSRGNGGGNGSGGKVNNVSFSVLSQYMLGNKLSIDFELKLLHTKKDSEISLIIASEGGWIDPKSWQDEIGTAFPAQITACEFKTMATGVAPEPVETDVSCDCYEPECGTGNYKACMKKAEKSSVFTGIKVQSEVLNLRVTGTMVVVATDKKYRFNFKIE